MSSTILPPPSPPDSYRIFGDPPMHTEGDLLALGFAPDGSLWSIEEPGILRHWDVPSRRPVETRELDEVATLWAFASGAGCVAAASDEVSLFDPASGERQADLPAENWVEALAFLGDGSLLAIGGDDGVIRLWDRRTTQLRHTLGGGEDASGGHEHSVSALAFSPDGKRLASASEDKVICIWDVESGELIGKLVGHTDRIPALAWHPDSRRLFSAGWDTTVRVWDASTLTPIILLNSHATQVHTLAISPDGKLLASADSQNSVHLWDVESYRTRFVLREQAGEVCCLAFSPDGQQLASGGADRLIHLWDVRQGPAGSEEGSISPFSHLESIDPGQARAAVAVGGGRVLSLGPGTPLRIWDLAEGRSLLQLEENPTLRAFALSPDGKWIAAAQIEHGQPEWNTGPPLDRRTLRLYETATGKSRAVLDGQPGPITALAFRPMQPGRPETVLASASYQSSDVWLWNVPGGEPRLLIPGALEGCSVEALAFHPDGSLLAIGGVDWLATSGEDGRVILWDLERAKERYDWFSGARALTFHPDGQLLATAALDDTICIWDLMDGGCIGEWPGHQDAVNCLAFSPDGKLLASGGDDSTLRLWEVASGQQAGGLLLDTQVKAVAFTPDGRGLVTGNGNTSCYLFEVGTVLGAE